MLTSVHIESFRSCSNVQMDGLGTLTALIGRNGAGKTNVLKAIEWAAMNAIGRTPDGPRWRGDTDGSIRLSFGVADIAYRYEITRTTEFVPSNPPKVHTHLQERLTRVSQGDQLLLERKGEQISLIGDPVPRELSISASAAAIPAVLSLLPGDNPLSAELLQVFTYFSGINYYPLEFAPPSLSSYFIQAEELAKWRSGGSNKASSSLESTALKIVSMSQYRSEDFFELCELLGEHGLGLIREIDVTAVPLTKPTTEVQQNFLLTFMPFDGTTTHPIQELSFGTQRLLQLITALIYDRSTVALIEQPEDGIHPGLLHKLAPLLRQYASESQYFLASHAPAVLNKVRPEELRIVSREEGITTVQKLTETQLASARLFLEQDGPLSDYIAAL